LCLHYNNGYNNKLLAIFCHVVYALDANDGWIAADLKLLGLRA